MDEQLDALQGGLMAQPRAVARRLRILQEWAGKKKQADMAATLGYSEARWNAYVNKRDLPKTVAFNIHETYPEISLEFLWLGELEQMELRVIRQLQAAAERIGEPFPEAQALSRRR